MTGTHQPQNKRSAFFVLLPTLECNLSCSYCFQKRISGRWEEDRALSVIDSVIAYSVERNLAALHIHWQGGEPLLLGIPFWERVLPETKRRAEQQGLKPKHTSLPTTESCWNKSREPMCCFQLANFNSCRRQSWL